MEKKEKYRPIHNYLSFEDLIKKSGYPTNGKCKGLSVNEVIQKKNSTVLKVAPAKNYNVSWLELALQKTLKLKRS